MVQRPFLPVSGAVLVPGCRGHRNVLLEVEPDMGESVVLLNEARKPRSGAVWREQARKPEKDPEGCSAGPSAQRSGES